MLLVRQLLVRREPGEPVPVLLNLVGWDPVRTHFDTWLARRIAADYPQLTTKRNFGTAAAQRMVDRSLVMPILDGLDEMPESARPQAIAALTAAIGSERPLVLTCRADEYEIATKLTGAPLAQAAVVELEPVSSTEIVTYLTAGHIDGDQRWDKVVDQLRERSDCVLAIALSTPLMAYLARIAYRAPGADPSSLVQASSIAEVEERLLAAYLPTMYTSDLVEPGWARLRHYKSKQARRWLGALALQMSRRGDAHLRLWSLRSIRGLPPLRAIRVTATVAFLMLWAFVAVSSQSTTLLTKALEVSNFLVAPLVFCFILLFLLALVTSNMKVTPFRVEIRPLGMIRGGLAGMLPAVAFFAIFILLAIFGGFSPKVDVHSLLGELVRSPFLWVNVAAGLISGLLVNPASKTEASDPLKALDHDLRAFLLVVIISMLSLGTVETIREGIVFPAIIGVLCVGFLFGIVVSAVRGVGIASCRWFVVSAILAMAGVLPFSSTDFLKDAHRRGILRVVGMEYQFRHVKIQAYLTASVAGSSVGRR